MSVNPYYNFHSFGTEQGLIESLIVESIKQYGMEMKYLPRSVVALDNLYGEDALRSYNAAAGLEMYIKDVDGFGGEGDFLSKFGLEIRDSMTFTVAKKRFDQIRTEKLLTELGFNLQLETANSSLPGNTSSLMLESGTANGYSITSSRPLEGDLIYFPLNQKLYEIKFVEHEAIFYQTGKLQTYDLRVELFEYSSESIDTGDILVDIVETENTLSVANTRILTENGDALLLEDGGLLVQEYTIETVDAQANNTLFATEAPTYIDFSESNPYGEPR